MRLFNTLSRKVEELEPVHTGRIGVYACGPTVYNFAHIGNLRTYIFEDVLTRMLRHDGLEVTHVMSVTDVGHLQSDGDTGEDKLTIGARREKKTPWEIARSYEEAFFRHCALLNIRRPDVVCRATEHIAEIIAMVELLLAKGLAYESGGNIYYDVSRFPSYADFAGLDLDEQLAIQRVSDDPFKRDQTDFVLWFSNSKFPNQVMKWHSPWGQGFPGWHMECSAMASKYLGPRIDIHCGGVDHIRVHHTNEIAQSEGCFEHRWVNVWFHCEFLNVQSGKMSKSAGEFLTIDSIVARGIDPRAYRMLMLGSHYRSSVAFSWDALESAARALDKLQARIGTLRESAPVAAGNEGSAAFQHHHDAFFAALRNDLRTPTALAAMWGLVRSEEVSDGEKLQCLKEFDDVLGLQLLEHSGEDALTLTDDLRALVAARDEARRTKRWDEADRLRAELAALGVTQVDPKS